MRPPDLLIAFVIVARFLEDIGMFWLVCFWSPFFALTLPRSRLVSV